MKFIGIIPARYQSVRFPGKPLVMIHGKPMIQHVYELAEVALGQVWVATDDQRISETVRKFGGNCIMTSPEHRSGTDRCAEAARQISVLADFDVVINIQGDEPFIQPEQIRSLSRCFSGDTEIATLVRRITDIRELTDPNKPKVVISSRSEALYFSRSAIPFARGVSPEDWLRHTTYLAHIGIYGFRADILQKITALSPGILETVESLEQLRWLENGFRIKVAETDFYSFGIDTPEDLAHALKHFK